MLFVWNYLEWGGAQIYFLAIIKGVMKKCDVKVVLPVGSNEQLLGFLDNLKIPYDELNANTDNKPANSLKRKIELHYKKLRSEYIFCRHLKKLELRDAAVHVEFAPWMSFAALFWLAAKTKTFTTVHNSVRPQQNWRYWIWKLKFGILCRMKNFHVFTANEDAKKCLREFVTADFYERIKVTYASINPAELESIRSLEIDKLALRRKFGIPADKFLVFCVGQFIDRKGRWIFLEAAQTLQQRHADIAFVWISNSKPAADDLRRAESYGLGENFVFITGEAVGKKREDLFKLIRLADIFALPSYIEGLPISLLEAMALSKPCVSTSVNGIPEAIRHLETGWLIEPGKPAELVEAIEALKANESLREKLAAQGREFVLQNFDERITAQKAWESYAEISSSEFQAED